MDQENKGSGTEPCGFLSIFNPVDTKKRSGWSFSWVDGNEFIWGWSGHEKPSEQQEK